MPTIAPVLSTVGEMSQPDVEAFPMASLRKQSGVPVLVRWS
jgi:hypothetical protein